jgi:hypothetical protein
MNVCFSQFPSKSRLTENGHVMPARSAVGFPPTI